MPPASKKFFAKVGARGEGRDRAQIGQEELGARPRLRRDRAGLKRFGNSARRLGLVVGLVAAGAGIEIGDLTRRVNTERKKKAADAPEFKWKHNALRHSFISYRVAETQDVAKVSLEAGNSPQIIFKNYRELVQPKEAKAWFAINPKS